MVRLSGILFVEKTPLLSGPTSEAGNDAGLVLKSYPNERAARWVKLKVPDKRPHIRMGSVKRWRIEAVVEASSEG